MKTLYTGRGKLRVANFQFIQRQNGIKFTVHGNLVVHFVRKEKCLKESWDLSFLEWECSVRLNHYCWSANMIDHTS